METAIVHLVLGSSTYVDLLRRSCLQHELTSTGDAAGALQKAAAAGYNYLAHVTHKLLGYRSSSLPRKRAYPARHDPDMISYTASRAHVRVSA